MKKQVQCYFCLNYDGNYLVYSLAWRLALLSYLLLILSASVFGFILAYFTLNSYLLYMRQL